MKSDLLSECNDQRIPPKDFKATFCQHCRNKACVNAEWSASTFESRIATQVERLLVHPNQAKQDDPRFGTIRALHFVEIAAAIALAKRADPWSGPGVHLSEPDPTMATSAVVEDAVTKLAETRGRRSLPVVVVEDPLVVDPPAVVAPRPVTPPDPGPRVPADPKPPQGMNTDFPDEGVMLGGSPPPAAAALLAADPWAPKPKMNVVPRGAKIKMEG